MWGKSFSDIASFLKRLGAGYLVWRDAEGFEFVVVAKSEFDRLTAGLPAEVQLPLPAQSPAADEVLGRINRELAEYQAAQALEAGIVEDLLDMAEAEGDVLKVRFEPLR